MVGRVDPNAALGVNGEGGRSRRECLEIGVGFADNWCALRMPIDVTSSPRSEAEKRAGAVGFAGGGLGWIALLGLGHFVIELGSSYALTRTLDDTGLGANGVFAYNAVAFWGQPLVGWVVDRWRVAKPLAMAGALLLLVGLLSLGAPPWPTVLPIALGNACYHVGGGVLAIRMSRGRAAGLGLFVGPGAIGLTLGVGLARMDLVPAALVLGGLSALLVWPLWRIGRRGSLLQDDPLDVSLAQMATQGPTVRTEVYPPLAAPEATRAAHYAQAAGGAEAVTNRLQAGSYKRISLALVVALVLGCIAIRSFVGSGFSFAWSGSAVAVLSVAAALAGGKIAGGFLADRFGWLAWTLVALALSVPALWYGETMMAAGLVGVALFQAPMAVTLGALVRTMPNRPGLAFGLASAFVYVGGYPLPGGTGSWLHSFAGLSLLSLAAALMLVAALRRWPRVG
jgi:FSR family fosmidomycin resistance protein-like MFS transporter